MNNGKENQTNHLLKSEVLKNIFRMPEVMRRARTMPSMSETQGAAIVLNIGQEFAAKWGNKINDCQGQYFRTEPVRISVNDEHVNLMIQSEKGRNEISILVEMADIHEKEISILFSVDFDNFKMMNPITAKNINGEKASLEEIRLALGLLSVIGESLAELPEKTQEAQMICPSILFPGKSHS